MFQSVTDLTREVSHVMVQLLDVEYLKQFENYFCKSSLYTCQRMHFIMDWRKELWAGIREARIKSWVKIERKKKVYLQSTKRSPEMLLFISIKKGGTLDRSGFVNINSWAHTFFFDRNEKCSWPLYLVVRLSDTYESSTRSQLIMMIWNSSAPSCIRMRPVQQQNRSCQCLSALARKCRVVWRKNTWTYETTGHESNTCKHPVLVDYFCISLVSSSAPSTSSLTVLQECRAKWVKCFSCQ